MTTATAIKTIKRLRSHIDEKYQERMMNDNSHSDQDDDNEAAASRVAAKEMYKQLIG